MNEMELKELKKGILLTATYYSKELKSEVISMMADDLSDLPFDVVSKAYQTYRRDPKNKFFPLPAQIREIIAPENTPDAEARETIDKIKIAIRDFGWASANEAKLFLGPVGWQIVLGMGGWQSVCESDFTYNPGLMAQARNRAEDLHKSKAVESFTALSAPEENKKLEENKSRILNLLNSGGSS